MRQDSQRNGRGFALLTLAVLILYFLWFLFFVFLPPRAQATTVKTGFLVVAEDRGFLGNRELEAMMTRFAERYTAVLILVGRDRQGIEDEYRDYIRRGVETLARRGVTRMVAIPLFVSAGETMLAAYRERIEAAVRRHAGVPLRWAEPLSRSWLAAEILSDRIRDLSSVPGQERLIVLALGAGDEPGARHIRADLERLLTLLRNRFSFKETRIEIYYEREAADHEARNAAVDDAVIRTAARRGRTLLVPFAIGVKFDRRMSLAGWLQRKFGEYDVALGRPLMPHPDLLTWLRQQANRHLAPPERRYGVIIMPHGSTRPYNDGLERVIAPLRDRYRIEVAPGMGDSHILASAVETLEREGFTHIVFVRLYALEGHMQARSDYILGITEQAPPDGSGPAPERVRSGAVFTSFGGYEESPLIAEILRERIMEISEDPARETVLLLAHGQHDEAADQRWKAVMQRNIERIRATLPHPFRAIEAMTLREDWPALRERSLARIFAAIEAGNRDGGRVLVIANRLYGAGPYRRLLAGQEFVLNDQGLVPHPNLTRWLEEGIEAALQGAWP